MPMHIIKTVEQMRDYRRALTGRVGFVPTMGALHDGHLSLMTLARQTCDHVVVSVFVNPTQFGPHEDFDRYPRPFEQDVERCAEVGVDCVFAPPVEQVYPPDAVDAMVDVPALAEELEAAERPGHFQGVCRVVTKLFNMVQPDEAVFGQKDYQQLAVVQAMVVDLAMPIEITGGPTLREPDGLAMSSRNRYLDETQRRHALGLSKALTHGKYLIEVQGEVEPQVVERAMAEVMTAHQVEVDYAAVRHARTLQPLSCIEPQVSPVVLLVAGRLGKTRLLDNVLIQ